MKIPLIVSVILCLVVSFSATAYEDLISVGRGPLTFPEIAQKLSTGVRTVDCASGLRDRAAFLCLKERSWDDVKTLLERGLDLRITPKSDTPGHWTLDRDPDTAKRERSWQIRLAAALRNELNRKIGASPNLIEPYAATYERQRELWQLAKRSSEGDKSTDAVYAARQYNMAASIRSPAAWITARVFAHGLSGDITDTFKHDRPYSRVELREFFDPESAHAVWAAMQSFGGLGEPDRALSQILDDHPLPDDLVAYVVIRFDALSFSLTLRTAIFGSGKLVESGGMRCTAGPIGGDSVFKGYHSDKSDIHFAGLGSEAVKWLDAERASTTAFLTSETARRSFTVKTSTAIHDMSSVLEAWCNGSEGEAVMELCPHRETLGACSVKKFELQPGARYTLSDILKPETIWTVHDRNGVFLVKNQFAFVDRLRDYPMSAYLTLERNWRKNGGRESRIQELSLDDLSEYARSVTAEQAAGWRASLRNDYRGLAIHRVAVALPGLLLLSHLNEKQRSELSRAMTNGESYQVALNKCPSAVFHTVLGLYHSAYGDSPVLLHPGFGDLVRSSLLRVSVGGNSDAHVHHLQGQLIPSDLPPEWKGYDLFDESPLCRWP